MLLDKVLSQTFGTDTWQATTAISADYSAEIIFLFPAFGMPSNRINIDNLTLVGKITSAEETAFFFCWKSYDACIKTKVV